MDFSPLTWLLWGFAAWVVIRLSFPYLQDYLRKRKQR